MGSLALRCKGYVCAMMSRPMPLEEACKRLEAHDASFRELELKQVDDRLVRALGRQSHLKSLTLRGVDIGQDLAGALAKQTQLTKLHLFNVRLGDATAASHLAAALRELKALETMTFWRADAGEEGVKSVLAVAVELPQLQTLLLSGSAINDASLVVLAAGLRNSQSLTRLRLYDFRASADGIKALAEAVVEHGLPRELDVFGIPIDDEGVEHLATMLERSRSLLVLNLDSCEIGDAGLDRLSQALTRNTTLQQLVLSNNEFSAEAVTRFADLMGEMHGLQVLEVGSEWEQQLLPGIERNCSLLELVPECAAARPFLQRNARGYDKAKAAVVTWLWICEHAPPPGINRDLGLIIARMVHATRGQRCWIEDDTKSTKSSSRRDGLLRLGNTTNVRGARTGRGGGRDVA